MGGPHSIGHGWPLGLKSFQMETADQLAMCKTYTKKNGRMTWLKPQVRGEHRPLPTKTTTVAVDDLKLI